MAKLAPKETKDRLMVYRNLLATEDHLEELKDSAESSDELQFIEALKAAIEQLRSIMAERTEPIKKWHCTLKHLSAAHEGQREVAKETRSTDDIADADFIRQLLVMVAEKAFDGKLSNCARCGVEDDSSKN